MRYLFGTMLVLVIAMGSVAVHAENVDAKGGEPDEKETAAIKDAIKKLQADEFEVRDKATDGLVAFGKKAVALLTTAEKETKDNEVRQRAKTILEKIAVAQELEGLITLESGLQYKVIKEGEGESPKRTDTVVCNYSGKFKDGAEFDSSYNRGEPAEFPVSGVIAGWTEALQKMKPGAKWVLVIPPKLAYGETGRPGIPPNSTLIFTVELISVKSK
jgi:FKBP-type peptidyl-prolyl cis-trans isomerase